jgi:hypothetical protein
VNAQQVERLIEKLTADLRDRFADDAAELALLAAASELWLEHDGSNAPNLRLLTARLVLDVLGVRDTAIERCRLQLATGLDPDTLKNWRH